MASAIAQPQRLEINGYVKAQSKINDPLNSTLAYGVLFWRGYSQ